MNKNPRDGILLMYSVPVRMTVLRTGLQEEINNRGLNQTLMPRMTADAHMFRKACREVINRPAWRSLVDGDGNKVKLSWTKIPTERSPEHRNKVQYDLMQQVIGGKVDAANFIENPVEHSVFKMFFHKDIQGATRDRISFQMTRDSNGDPDTSTWADGIDYYAFVKDVIDQVDVYHSTLDSEQILEAMKRYIRSMNGTLYRRMRAVWYIPEASVDHAKKFQDAIRSMSDGEIDIHHVPVYADQTAEMKEFFEERLLNELQSIDDEIDLSGRMQQRLITRILKEIAWFKQVADAYQGKVDRARIDTALAVVAGKMELAVEANKQWLADKEAAAIRKAEEKKRVMKEKKERTKLGII